MKKKVLLVYPEMPITYWGFEYALRFIGKKASIPPLGLMTVAAMLPDEFEVKLIDMNVSPLNRNDIEESDLVFISAMIVQKRCFAEVVKLCNECGKPVVAGGPYPISSHAKIKGVDHFVLDEAELTLPAFLKDLEAGCAQKIYRDRRKPDISETPIPRFDLVDVSAYSSMPLQFSRGCPFNCEFCDIIEMFGRIPRTKLPEQFIREMEAVYETGFRNSIFIVDDNFAGNKRKVKALLRKLITWQQDLGFPFAFFTEASIDLAQDDELLDLMLEAGFNMVFVGIETPDEATLALTQKKHNLRSNMLESVEKLQRRGIEVSGGFIIGFDSDPPDIFDRQINFIQSAGIPMAMVGLLTAMPNTQLFRRLKAEGRLLHDGTGNNTDLKMNFIPRMPLEVLAEGFKRVISELYSAGRYFERCLTFLKRLPEGTGPPGAISWVEIKAFLLSLARQTFSNYGVHYLRFLIKTLRHNAKHFPEAVVLAIRGHHFFNITQDILKADEFAALLLKAMQAFQSRVSEVVGQRKRHLAAELETQVLKLKNSFQRKYRRMSLGVQRYLTDSFLEFEAHCESVLCQLRVAYL